MIRGLLNLLRIIPALKQLIVFLQKYFREKRALERKIEKDRAVDDGIDAVLMQHANKTEQQRKVNEEK